MASGGCGTIFSVSLKSSNAVKVVYSMQGEPNDALDPRDGVLLSNGTLYVVGENGGSSNNCDDGEGETSCGALIAVSAASGKKTGTYSFQGLSDGSIPDTTLVNVNGTFWGTTTAGGGSAKCDLGCGTIFTYKP